MPGGAWLLTSVLVTRGVKRETKHRVSKRSSMQSVGGSNLGMSRIENGLSHCFFFFFFVSWVSTWLG